jgi:2-methylcitrate synthase
MAEKKLSGAGLRGQVAGETALCTVGKTGTGLTYRGYDISELAEKAKFEEVAFLLLKGHLPTQSELTAYTTKLQSLRSLPDALKEVLERIPASAHPMDVMRTGCSMLGNLETETDFAQQDDAIDRLLALLPAIICYWYRFSHDGVRIDTALEDSSIGGHFLHMLSGEAPSELFEQVMNVSLILYAEHEFNASTFTARVCASTLSDMHSCITAAIGSLRGPLHGGANEAAMEMIEDWTSPEQAESEILGMLARKDKIMGFGHAIYSESDPRNTIIKKWSEKLAAEVGDTRSTQFRCAAKKLCGARRSSSAMQIFSMRLLTTSWEYPPSCSRRYSLCHASRAGQRMSKNSERIIESFVRVLTIPAPRRRPGLISLTVSSHPVTRS